MTALSPQQSHPPAGPENGGHVHDSLPRGTMPGEPARAKTTVLGPAPPGTTRRRACGRGCRRGLRSPPADVPAPGPPPPSRQAYRWHGGGPGPLPAAQAGHRPRARGLALPGDTQACFWACAQPTGGSDSLAGREAAVTAAREDEVEGGREGGGGRLGAVGLAPAGSAAAGTRAAGPWPTLPLSATGGRDGTPWPPPAGRANRWWAPNYSYRDSGREGRRDGASERRGN